jgi:tetratricopeptide (TPR) repeat protein
MGTPASPIIPCTTLLIEERMSDDETPEKKANGLEGLFSALGPKEAVRHLLQGCGPCREAALQGRLSRAAARREALPRELSAGYDNALNRAQDFARRLEALPAGERKPFKKALALLRSGKGVLGLAQGPEGLLVDGLGVYEALLARSWEIRYDNPREMRHLAKVAMEMARDFDPAVYGAQKVADLQARAWGELGNAYRVGDLFPQAREAFATAFSFQQQGTGDGRLIRRLLDLESSLFGDTRELESAHQRLTILARKYRDEGDEHMEGRTLVTRALYTYYNCQAEQALETLSEALKLIDEKRDPDLMMVAALNEILFLIDCGRCQEARKALFKKRTWIAQGGRIAQVKIRWTEGLIAYGLEEFESAEIILREARMNLEKTGLAFSSALASLNLAMTLMRLDRKDEAVQEGIASAQMFIALSMQREILGTVVLIREALQDGTADIEFLESMSRFLRRKLMQLGLS